MRGRVGRLEISYDKDADVLYVSVGHPRAADTSDSDYGLLLRKDPETSEVVGATILHYGGMFKKLLDRSWLKQLDLPEDLAGCGKKNFRSLLPHSGLSQRERS